jgi:hypothetical protein
MGRALFVPNLSFGLAGARMMPPRHGNVGIDQSGLANCFLRWSSFCVLFMRASFRQEDAMSDTQKPQGPSTGGGQRGWWRAFYAGCLLG